MFEALFRRARSTRGPSRVKTFHRNRVKEGLKEPCHCVDAWPSPCASSRWRNLQTVVARAGARDPDGRPHRRRVIQRLFHGRIGKIEPVLAKYIHSIRSNPTDGRPFPGFGTRSRYDSSRQGTTRSISARNWALRITFFYFSKPVSAASAANASSPFPVLA